MKAGEVRFTPHGVRVIRREMLEMVVMVLKQNAVLLRESLADLDCRPDELDEVVAAIQHVTEEDFRSPETRGGS